MSHGVNCRSKNVDIVQLVFFFSTKIIEHVLKMIKFSKSI
jgi:hypothetical protein